MAASSISILALLLLMSAVTPGLSTEGEGSQDHTSTALIIAMREVSRALECFGDAVQEGLRQQRQSSDALTDLHTLTATVLRVEERLNQQGGMIESLKEKNEDITKLNDLQVKFEAKSRESEQNLEKVEILTQEIEDLKNQLHNKNHTLDDLQVKCEAKSRESEVNLEKVGDLQRLLDNKTSENERNVDKLNDLQVKFEAKSRESEQHLEKVGNLQRLLDNKTSENERNVDKVQDLGRNLDESRRYAEKLEQLVQQLNNTQESKKKDVPGCAEQPSQKIKNLVLQYSVSGDWQTLCKGLDAEMDHSSGAYGELKDMFKYSGYPHWQMGIYGYTQLVTLLLCAGMPVDLPDRETNTLLHGAASGGSNQIAQMLLSRGANVNAMDNLGFTPLMEAADRDHLVTVKLLVQAGADTTLTNRGGSNALYFAKVRGHTAVQQYLEQLPV